MIILKPGDVCSFEGCNRPAVGVACGRERRSYVCGSDIVSGHPTVAVYCGEHADIVEAEGSPEYVQTCPNCACSFGVN